MKKITDRSLVGKLLWGVLVFSLFFHQTAFADEATSTTPGSAEERRLEARERYKKGKELYDASDYVKALDEFQAAYEARPHPVVLKSIAECNVMLNRITDAIETLETFLQDEKAKGRADVEKRIEELRRLLATVEFKSEPMGATISLNGQETRETTPSVLEVGPGNHEIVFSVEDYEPLTKKVYVESGQSVTIVANFPMEGTKATGPSTGTLIDPFEENEGQEFSAQEEKGGPPAGFWVCAALAGVGLVSGTVFGTMALNSEEDYKKDHSPSKKEAGEREAIIADVSFGFALASAIVGTIVLFTYDKGEKKEEELAQEKDPVRFRVTGITGRDTVGLSAVMTF